MHGGVRQPPGGRGAVHLRQPGDEFFRLDRAAGHSLRCSPVFVMFVLVTRLTREYVDQASGDVRKCRRAPEFEALMAC